MAKKTKQKSTIDYSALLAPFCMSPEEEKISRYQLSKPWYDTGWLYASDGAVLVRVPSLPIKNDNGMRPNNVASFFVDFQKKNTWVPALFEVDGPPVGNSDTWWRTSTCECCGQTWEEGEGELVETKESIQSIAINESHFGRRYLWLIRQLPDVQFFIVKKSKKRLLHDSMIFKSQELQGVLRPLSY